MAVRVTEEDIQERADQFRRVRGLHRASDTNKYLDALRVEPGRVRGLHHDGLYQEKMMRRSAATRPCKALQAELAEIRQHRGEPHRARFRGQGEGDDLQLRDDPDSFDEMAREHSIADTRDERRPDRQGAARLAPADVEAKVFNARR